MKFLRSESGPFAQLDVKDYAVPKDSEVRGFIYMVEDSAYPEFVKIGKTTDLHKRLLGYNSDRPQATVTVTAVTSMFFNVSLVESRILEAIYNYHKVAPAKGTREWFPIEYKKDFLKLMELAESKFDLAPAHDTADVDERYAKSFGTTLSS